jgi:Kef-type K+ transport system membrane component KefB
MNRNYRYILYYLLTIGGFLLLIYYVVIKGETLMAGGESPAMSFSLKTGLDNFRESVNQNVSNPLPLLLLQIVIIITFARAFGYLCTKIGQPSVIGEVIAGIVLGPSLLGMFAPGVSHFLFPPESLNTLSFFSQLGLILFMFIIGMDIDLRILKSRAPDALVASHASIVIPFALGMGLAYFIYSEFAPQGVPFISFALFIGISMSITAFPILARILQERNLIRTRVGVLAITCAVVDDISAWCILAALIALVKAGSFVSALYTILLSVLYIVVMLLIIRPFLHRVGDIYNRKEGISKPVVALFILTLLLSSYVTEIIGIHAIFGAFVAGTIMPPNINFRKILIEKIEDLATILLLPIFFVITGLRMEIGLLNSLHLWEITGWIIIIAVAGKFGGSALSLKFVGQPWRESLIIGALMNTRGLMQIVVLSIGYEMGVLTPGIFTIMILMAIVTTIMTGPALNIIDRFFPDRPADEEKRIPEIFRILISFGNPENGKKMLMLASNFIKKSHENAGITLLHLSPAYNLHKYNTDEYEQESFRPIFSEAENLGLDIKTMFKASEDIDRDIIETANSGYFDLIIAGKAHSLYEGTLLGKFLRIIMRITNPERIYESLRGTESLFSTTVFDGPTRRLIKSIKIPTGIFVDNDFSDAQSVIVPVFSSEDAFLFTHAGRLILNNGSRVKILDIFNQIAYSEELKNTSQELFKNGNGNIEIIFPAKVSDVLSSKHDLMIVSYEGWHKVLHDKRFSSIPSCLIIRP